MGVNNMRNEARRLDETNYRQQSRNDRSRNLRIVEDKNERRTYNYDQYENYDSKTTTVHYQKRDNVFVSQLIITAIVMFLFVSCIGFLAVRAQVAQVERDISRLNTEIFELTTENNMMESIISTATNIETIRENAAMLGMSKPEANQVQYISASEASVYSMSSAGLGN